MCILTKKTPCDQVPGLVNLCYNSIGLYRLNVLSQIWAEEKARPPLVLLSLIVSLTLLWLVFGESRQAPQEETTKSLVEVVVKGSLEGAESAYLQNVDPTRAVTVHLSIPEIAYQRDTVVIPQEDGTFELSLSFPTEKPEYRFDLDLSQGTNRWRVRTNQTLDSGQPTLDLATLPLEPPTQTADPRATIKKQDVSSSQSRAETREQRRLRRRERKEQKRQRRGRPKER